jgi:hypothetical protein
VVSVYREDGTLAALYSDDGVTAQANPMRTDANGEFSFYAADGVYSITLAKNGHTARTISGVALLDGARVQAPVADYPALRAYAGGATSVFVRASGIAGTFVRDDADTTSADNGGTIIVAANGKRWKRVFDGAVDIRWFGAVDGGADSTSAVVAAFSAHDVVHAAAGVWNVSTFSVGAGKTLLTDGLETVFQQIAGQAVGTRVIRVTGSNASIGSLTIRGNIATDTDEQNHGIFIQANAIDGDISNVSIGDVHGQDIRGDVVYIGQANGGANALKNIHVGNVSFDNVYRNGVSIVSCDGFSIESITGTRCGFCHIDAESNATSGPVRNGRIGYVKGRLVGLIGTTTADYVDNVEIGVLDLSPSHAAQSSPIYAAGAAILDGVTMRNVRRARIGMLRAEGFGRFAFSPTYNAGELGVQDLEIGSVYARNCSLTDAVYNSFIQWGVAGNWLRIGHLDIAVSGANKRGIDGMLCGVIDSIEADVQSSASLLRNCSDVVIGSIRQSGAGGIMLNNCNRVSVRGGSMTGDRLTSGSAKCSFQNFTATATTAVFVSGDSHSVVNCTLNSDYYGFGQTVRAHTSPMRFGGYNSWVDAFGMLRLQGSTPASDTDGFPLAKKVAIPATATTAGAPGQWAADNSNFYVYTGDGTTHTWRRVGVAVW